MDDLHKPYSWSAHVRQACALLKRDGSGWTNKAAYGLDEHKNSIQLVSDPRIVKYSLLGVNYKVLFMNFPPELEHKKLEDYWKFIARRSGIMMNLYFKVGLPKIPNSHPSTALLKFGYAANWNDVEKLLRDAYSLAIRTEKSGHERRTLAV